MSGALDESIPQSLIGGYMEAHDDGAGVDDELSMARCFVDLKDGRQDANMYDYNP